MDIQKLHNIFEYNMNSLMSNEDNHAPSMRYLSACIGASDGYIQKILNSESFPSVEKLNSIAEHYDIEPWTLLYNAKEHGDDFICLLKLLEKCPPELLPTISKFVEFLLDNHGD